MKTERGVIEKENIMLYSTVLITLHSAMTFVCLLPNLYFAVFKYIIDTRWIRNCCAEV